jgi:hypothetical protein
MGCAASLLIEQNQDNHYLSSSDTRKRLLMLTTDGGGDSNLRALTLRQVMQDPLGKKYFRKFLEDEHAEENLRFFEVSRGFFITLLLTS